MDPLPCRTSIGVPSPGVSSIGREGRSQRLIHEITPSKTEPNWGVRMDFEWPNDSRTSNKRDEIRAASLPQGSIPTIGHSPHLRRSRDIPPVKLAHEQRAVD